MGRMPQLVRKGKKDRRLGEPNAPSWEEIEGLDVDARVELIRALVPLGLAEVGRMLDEEVERLAGPRHGRKAEGEGRRYRHGTNPGSVRLAGQRHPIRVPRVRDHDGEVKLVSYAELHGSSGEVDEGLFRKVLRGISCRDYEAAVEAVPSAIGMSKSQVSREFKKATAAQLKEFQERDLAGYDVVAVFMDGKTFADDQMVIALGVTVEGDKVFLGFVQTVAWTAPAGLRAAHLRGGEAGPEGDPRRARRGEPVRGGESGRGLRGVPHPTPARRLRPGGPIPKDHQRDRVRPQHGRAALRPGRVDHWNNSHQKHRWLATALLNIEPRLRRLLGYRHLPRLRAAIQEELGITHPDSNTHSVA